MLPGLTLPATWQRLLDPLRDCFRARTFAVFSAMVIGLITHNGPATVCSMLTGAGLAHHWPHDRAHRFFSTARWSAELLGLCILDLIIEHLLPPDAPILLAVDDTAHRRTGRHIHGAGWVYDGSAPHRTKLSFGHRWVILGVVVQLPFLTRPVCLPVAAARWAGKGTATPTELAATLITRVAGWLPTRRIHVVADAAYHGKPIRDLLHHLPHLTYTCRLPRNATLYHLAPTPTGRRGRPRTKGPRLGTLTDLIPTLRFTPTTVYRYGRTTTVHLATLHCLWYGAFGPHQLRLIVLRDHKTTATGKPTTLVLGTTDLTTPADHLISRYAQRWASEVTFNDTRHHLGVGQARNRTPTAVARTLPFGMYVYSLLIIWYATQAHDPTVVTARRAQAPWHTHKNEPSFADMLATARRTFIAARFLPTNPAQPTPTEIRQVQHAWALAAA